MKKKILRFLVFVLLIITSSGVCQGLEASLSISDQFEVGETVFFNYTIDVNQTSQVVYTPYISCPEAPQPFVKTNEILITSKNPYSSLYRSLNVQKEFEPQECTAYLSISSPDSILATKNFTIDIKPSLRFRFYTCKDRNCWEKKRVFTKNEPVWILYESEETLSQVDSYIEGPEGNKQSVDLPKKFSPEKIGVYEVSVEAKKEGFKKFENKKSFEVIKDHISLSDEAGSEKSPPLFLYVIIILVVAVMIFIFATSVDFRF